jgi:hypothetical protein
MRKGYLLVVFFALFIGVSSSLKYRLYIKQDLGEATANNLITQGTVLFLVFLIPGLLAVRWYYKQKDKR